MARAGSGEDAEERSASGRWRDSKSAAGFLRSKVAKALSTRTMPELHFELDRGLEHAARINAVLADLKREEDGLIGALLVDKPEGPTSHDVVARVRRLLRYPRGGSRRNARPVRHRTAGPGVRGSDPSGPLRRAAAQELPARSSGWAADRHR